MSVPDPAGATARVPSPREAVLARVVAAVVAAADATPGHPCRVAVDGMTGTGKTTFRGELAAALRAAGREVVEASGDDFHHPREIRYRQGRGSAQGYYEDAYAYGGLASRLLAPLGPGGDGRVRLKYHDLETDAILDDEPVVDVGAGAVLVVDGSFLQRPELDGLWDLVIVLTASRAASAARQVVRDGAPSDPADAYHARYFGAYDLYVAERNPVGRADIVVDNEDVAAPVIVRGA